MRRVRHRRRSAAKEVAEMKDAALFIGWGGAYPGREHQAIETFKLFVAGLTELQESGEIESFEPVLLAPHGGELQGFVLVYGEREKLAALPERPELHELQARAGIEHGKLSIIPAITGARVVTEFALLDELAKRETIPV
jgi:hypothetical protein